MNEKSIEVRTIVINDRPDLITLIQKHKITHKSTGVVVIGIIASTTGYMLDKVFTMSDGSVFGPDDLVYYDQGRV